MKAQKIPVFTVGVGSEQLPRDVQIDRVSTPRTVLKDASLLVDVVVRNTGYGGRSVTVDVEDEGRIIGLEKVQLPRRRSGAGPRPRDCLRARAAAVQVQGVAAGRRAGHAEQRARVAVVNVRDAREQILYFEGEPRFEMKFLRRGVADDKNLEVVALQRTADNKYMRIFGDEPEDPEELVGGIRRRAKSSSNRGLILGSVEAGVFSGDQLQMIAEFVERRGGLLMLGGPRSFGEGAATAEPNRRRAAAAHRSAHTRIGARALARFEGHPHPTRAGARGHADCRFEAASTTR